MSKNIMLGRLLGVLGVILLVASFWVHGHFWPLLGTSLVVLFLAAMLIGSEQTK